MVISSFPERRQCKYQKRSGEPCRAAPVQGERYCFMHAPKYKREAAEARRVGGLHRRREGTLATVYAYEGLGSVEQIRRLVEVAATDVLGQESSLARARALGYLAQVAVGLLEKGELEARLAALEAAAGSGAAGGQT